MEKQLLAGISGTSFTQLEVSHTTAQAGEQDLARSAGPKAGLHARHQHQQPCMCSMCCTACEHTCVQQPGAPCRARAAECTSCRSVPHRTVAWRWESSRMPSLWVPAATKVVMTLVLGCRPLHAQQAVSVLRPEGHCLE